MAQKVTISEVVLRYTQALYILSEEKQVTQQISGELEALCNVLNQHSILERAFFNPVISNRQHVNLCKALSEKLGLSEIGKNFICVLASKGRLNLLKAIEKKFQEFWTNSRGETKIEVTSAHLLNDDTLSSLKAQLEQMTGKSVFVDNKVDSNIIAGLIIKIGSHMFDFSAQTRLRRIAHHMEGL